MATITMSSKNQVTLPAEMVRGLGLKPGDKLMAHVIDDRIVLLPKPESWTDYFSGSMKGFWGTKEEVDRYVADERRSPERDEWREEFDDLVATGGEVRAVVEALKSFPYRTGNLTDLKKRSGLREADVRGALEKLVDHGGVRKIRRDEGKADAYRLVHEMVER